MHFATFHQLKMVFWLQQNFETLDNYNEALENVARNLSGVSDIDDIFLIMNWKRKISAMMEYIH